MYILIKTQKGDVKAEIQEKKNPKTAKGIIQSLPINSIANTWGQEIYFEIPISLELENAQQDVEIGDLAYWPPGKAFCIFFGRTPVSKSEKPQAYSDVNVFGTIIEGLNFLQPIKDGDKIKVILG